MKNRELIAWGGVALLTVVGLSGCGTFSQEAKSGINELAEMWTEINADGVITPAEEEAYGLKVKQVFGQIQDDANSLDWEQMAYSIGGAASVAFFGVNIFRNKMQGKGFVTPKPSA